MSRLRSEAHNGLRCCVLGLAAIAAVLIFSSHAADARHHRRVYGHFAHVTRHAVRVHRHVHVEPYSPPFASIVVDGNSAAVLQASNPDARRHPASLTKIMTLYLLFERLDAGSIKLDSALKISAHAAEQAPTKLGLKPGQTIAVEDAIKAVVTKSANDIAVAIAETLAGDEDAFAKLMTQKARALGMSQTTYVNASGLPDDDQITTARDQALLGRAIEDRFPRYYRYFSTTSFVYHGEAIRNHNHLLGAVAGVDGIKTGYTRASGFNLVTSVHRDGRYIVAVVLGGHSAFQRDAHMRELISDHIREAALRRVAPAPAENAEQRHEPQPVAFAKAPLAARTDPAVTAAASAQTPAGTNDPIRPFLVRTISYRTAPVQTASLAPMPPLVPVAAPPPQPAMPPPGRAQAALPPPEAPRTVMVSSAELATVASSTRSEAAAASTSKPEAIKTEAAKAPPTKAEPAAAEARTRSGWVIQIGAFEDEGEAKQHLSTAQSKARALAAADPFTERVQKGEKALYRARFAGFDKETAAAACKELKRSDIDCMTVRN